MKTTLLLCEYHPSIPRTGGVMRTMNFVSFFKNYGPVHLAYTYSARPIVGETRDVVFSGEYFLRKQRHPKGLLQHFFRFAKGVPYPILEYHADSQRVLTALITSGDYDYILVRYINPTVGVARLSVAHRRRIIVDFDDLISGSLYDSFFAPAKNTMRKLLRKLNNALLKNYEIRQLKFGASLFCSEKDRVKVAGKQRNNAFVVPNVYDSGVFAASELGDGSRNANTLLFVGTLNYVANVEGLKWFLASGYRELKRRCPNLILLVVGRSPSREIRDLCETTEGVELHADAPDIKEYYRRCRAVVVPLLTGGGTRIKILEAALARRPVLSTPLGAEGLGFKDGADLLLFHDAHEFCSKYEALFDIKRYNWIVENARRAVLTKYSARVFQDAMERVVSYLDGP